MHGNKEALALLFQHRATLKTFPPSPYRRRYLTIVPPPCLSLPCFTALRWRPFTCFYERQTESLKRFPLTLHDSGRSRWKKNPVCMCVYSQKVHVAVRRDDPIHDVLQGLLLPSWFSPISTQLIQDALASLPPNTLWSVWMKEPVSRAAAILWYALPVRNAAGWSIGWINKYISEKWCHVRVCVFFSLSLHL